MGCQGIVARHISEVIESFNAAVQVNPKFEYGNTKQILNPKHEIKDSV